MQYFLLIILALFGAGVALAQPPADAALQRAQHKAGTAYSELQKAEFETERAERNYRRLDDDHKAALKRADNLKQKADAAKEKFDAAKSKEAGARKSYDAAVDAVDTIAHPAAKKR